MIGSLPGRAGRAARWSGRASRPPRRERLRPLLKKPVPLRVALHKHPGVKGVVEAGIALLGMVPGVEVVDLGQPAVGLAANALNPLPEYKRALQRAELEAAEEARHLEIALRNLAGEGIDERVGAIAIGFLAGDEEETA